MKKKEIENLTVRGTLERLKNSYKINIGYTGLMYYRNLGLINPPQKMAGYKERFYNIDDLATRITAIKLISDIFDINFKDMAEVAKKLPQETFNRLPTSFIRVYSNLVTGFNDVTGKIDGEIFENPATLRIASGCFLHLIYEMLSKAKGVSSDDFYFGVIEKRFRVLFLDTLRKLNKPLENRKNENRTTKEMIRRKKPVLTP